MEQKKLAFANDVIRIVHEVSRLAFNLQTDQDIERVFGLTRIEIDEIIEKITQELPDVIFTRTERLEEIKNIFAKEFIFFQVRERDVPQYEDDLLMFVTIFARDIQEKFTLYQSI